MKLTEARDTKRKDGVLWTHGMASKQACTIFKGGLTMLDGKGMAVSGHDEEAGKFIGVAYETKRYEAGTDADNVREIRVFRKGCFLFDCYHNLHCGTDFVSEHFGADVFIIDDHTVSTDFHRTGYGNHCGRIVAIETEHTCWIDIEGCC